MQNKRIGKTQLKWAAKGSKTKAVLYREITFKEAIYSDGLRAIVDARAKCFRPSGRSIPFQEGVAIAKALKEKGQLNQWPYPRETTLLTVFQHWLENGFEETAGSSAEIVRVYLKPAFAPLRR